MHYSTLLSMSYEEKQQYIAQHEQSLFEHLLQNLGNAEAEYHDKIVYNIFAQCIMEDLIPTAKCREIAMKLPTAQYLYSKIEESENDDIFKRTFSALWLALLLQLDAKKSFLEAEEVSAIMELASPYLAKERDLRGFIETKGWAHSAAHGADLYVALIKHPLFELKWAPIILHSVKAVFFRDYVFIDDEEERLAAIFIQLAAIHFPEEVCIEWVEQVFDKLSFEEMQGVQARYFHAKTNVLRFMRALYFSLKFSNKMPQLQNVLIIFIGKWTPTVHA